MGTMGGGLGTGIAAAWGMETTAARRAWGAWGAASARRPRPLGGWRPRGGAPGIGTMGGGLGTGTVAAWGMETTEGAVGIRTMGGRGGGGDGRVFPPNRC